VTIQTIVGFTTTSPISAYHWVHRFPPSIKLNATI